QEIYKDRQKFSDQVFRVASSDLVNMGISVVSYTLKDVHDEQGALAVPVAPVSPMSPVPAGGPLAAGHRGAARGGGSGCPRGPSVPNVPCPRRRPARSRPSRRSAGRGLWLSPWPQCPQCPLSPQAARSQQAIAAQRGEVALVERAQRAQLQEQEVGRRRQELEATVRKPAEAERYRLERLAEAHR
ncbi:FLOT1 protein, partial [Oenanthe oenanthe]|nr:FLOT1 protein [Oenanthe oenanthe]